jgi:hypothetical protein
VCKDHSESPAQFTLNSSLLDLKNSSNTFIRNTVFSALLQTLPSDAYPVDVISNLNEISPLKTLKKSTTLSKTSTPTLNLKDQNSKPDNKLEVEKNVTRDNNFDTKSIQTIDNNEIKHNKPNSINKEQNYENINSYLESLPDLSFMLK